MGFKIAPPHFVSFPKMVLYSTAWFGTVWGAMMWMAAWSRQGLHPGIAISIACGAGLFFGLSRACYYAYGRRKYGLPAWETL